MRITTIVAATFMGCAGAAITPARAQTPGCTDPAASNYNAAATANDGSCLYPTVSVTPYAVKTLSDTLQETSGLVFYNNLIWTHNDNTDRRLHALDTATGSIVAQTLVQTGINLDWEEITQDSSYLYIGDFGNNVNGNRTDLHILRVPKSGLTGGTVLADTIRFVYADQTSFTPTGNNNTDFDCEAFIATNDSLYLFTKQWVSKKTSVYALPKLPSSGSYTATLRYTYDVLGLITGAAYVPDKNTIVLCGYNTNSSTYLSPFVFLLYDFQGDQFFSGNKRRIDVAQPFSQIEGITTGDGKSFFLSNERLGIPPLTIPARLQQIDLTPYLQPYYQTSSAAVPSRTEQVVVYPNPASDRLTVQVIALKAGKATLRLVSNTGRIVGESYHVLRTGSNGLQLSLSCIAAGPYHLSVITPEATTTHQIYLSR